jgi:hypothetical protein
MRRPGLPRERLEISHPDTNNIGRHGRTRRSSTSLLYTLRTGIWKFVHLLVRKGSDSGDCVFPRKGLENVLQLVREKPKSRRGGSPLEPEGRATIKMEHSHNWRTLGKVRTVPAGIKRIS